MRTGQRNGRSLVLRFGVVLLLAGLLSSLVDTTLACPVARDAAGDAGVAAFDVPSAAPSAEAGMGGSTDDPPEHASRCGMVCAVSCSVLPQTGTRMGLPRFTGAYAAPRADTAASIPPTCDLPPPRIAL